MQNFVIFVKGQNQLQESYKMFLGNDQLSELLAVEQGLNDYNKK